MTSTIKVDTLKHRGTDQIVTACSAHGMIDQTNSTAVIESGSINFSSVTDLQTGRFKVDYTNNFSHINYANPCASNGGGTTGAVVFTNLDHNSVVNNRLTSSCIYGVRKINDNAENDREFNALATFGDLA